MRYLVTGATGFIGRRVARQLLGSGHDVVAFVRSAERARELEVAGASLAVGDATDRAAVRAAMSGVDGVFHVAGLYRLGDRDPEPLWRANVEATRCVLEAVGGLGIPKAVFTSTISINSDTHGRVVDEGYVYRGPHLTVYDETKWVAHHEVAVPLQRIGAPIVIVQPGLVYGPGDHSPFGAMLREYLRRRLPMVPLGMTHCWAHVEDAARGHLLAMERGRPGESYIICGPPSTLVDVLAMAESICGLRAPPIRALPGILKALALLADAIDDLLPVPSIYRGETIRASAGVIYLATDAKARRELGFTTRPLEDGLRDTLVHELRAMGRPLPTRPS